MSEKEKDLLFKDLCARLPYGVKVYNEPYTVDLDNFEFSSTISKTIIDIIKEEWKPYLRPMSSMTEEEKEELRSEFGADMRDEDNGRHTEIYGYVIVYHNFNGESWYIPFEAIDWLNAHHFDYRGLIEKGLALEAPEGMYK